MTGRAAASEGGSQQERVQEKSEGLGKWLNPGIVSVLRRTLVTQTQTHFPFHVSYVHVFICVQTRGVVQQRPPHCHRSSQSLFECTVYGIDRIVREHKNVQCPIKAKSNAKVRGHDMPDS